MTTKHTLFIPFAALLFFLALCLNSPLFAQQIIDLKDYGVQADSYTNAVRGIQEALAEARKYDSAVIKFPTGRIDLWPDGAVRREYFISNGTESDTLSKVKTIGIFLENMRNIRLEGGSGTLIVSHGKMVHLALDNSENIQAKNLAFDYERPTMSEVTVEKIGSDFLILKVHPDSRYAVKEGKITWFGEGWKSNNLHVIRFDPKEEMLFYERSGTLVKGNATDLGDRRILIQGLDLGNTLIQPGDILTFRDPYRDNVGILNHKSKNLYFENLGLHYLHGMGMLSQFSENIHVNGVKAAPRPETGRVIAGFADFLHFSGCSGQITVENSLFSGSHDDPINVHGTHLRIVRQEGNKINVQFMHHQTWNLPAFELQDSIGFVDNNNLEVYAFAQIQEVKFLNPKELELTLDRNVPTRLAENHNVENITKTPSVWIHHNRFEHTNTRGLLVTTRREVLIEDNVFFRTGMHAIMIANDSNYWYESGPVKDVLIRRNQFIECGYNNGADSYPIAIIPEVLSFEPGKFVHSNIRILDNEFILGSGALLKVRGTQGLTFQGNRIRTGNTSLFLPSDRPLIDLEHNDQVSFLQNRFEGYNGNRTIRAKGMDKKSLQVGKDQGIKLEYVEE
jgi:hypothetical protein